jgi:hypothetical protein
VAEATPHHLIDLQASAGAAAAPAPAKGRVVWAQLGAKLGVGLCGVGLLLVFLGWNGAASVDRVQSQFPYLISGGIGGLSLVLIGVGLIVVQNQRSDRVALQDTIRRLHQAIEENAASSAPSGAPGSPGGNGFAPVTHRQTPDWVADDLP